MTKKRVRNVPINIWVRPDELETIQERMAEAGIRNMSAYIRKMALGGYVLHVDLSPVKELVSLQRRCANNLNQAAIHANSYGGFYPECTKCGCRLDYYKTREDALKAWNTREGEEP